MSLNTIKECNDRLAAMGHKRKVFSNLKRAQAYVASMEKVAAVAGKPVVESKNWVHNPPVASASPTAPKTAKRTAILSAIESAKSPSELADLYQKLSDNLLADIKSETDLVKQTELRRSFQRSEKNRALSLQAERQLDPNASRARDIMAQLDKNLELQ
jgi:hypothetical protein